MSHSDDVTVLLDTNQHPVTFHKIHLPFVNSPNYGFELYFTFSGSNFRWVGEFHSDILGEITAWDWTFYYSGGNLRRILWLLYSIFSGRDYRLELDFLLFGR